MALSAYNSTFFEKLHKSLQKRKCANHEQRIEEFGTNHLPFLVVIWNWSHNQIENHIQIKTSQSA